MENKEFAFKGTVMNGFLMLFVNFAILVLAVLGIIYSIIQLDGSNGAQGGWLLGGSILLLFIFVPPSSFCFVFAGPLIASLTCSSRGGIVRRKCLA